MIYSVVPEEMAPELYDKLVEYYKDDPNVKVIIDRRKSERRARAESERIVRLAPACDRLRLVRLRLVAAGPVSNDRVGSHALQHA